jgi:hypothetical protein
VVEGERNVVLRGGTGGEKCGGERG